MGPRGGVGGRIPRGPRGAAFRAQVSAEVVGVHAEGIGPEGAHWRPPKEAERLVPRGRCGCPGLVQVGRGEASGRSWRRRDGGGRQRKPGPRGSPVRPGRARRSSYLEGPGGRGHLRDGADSPDLGAAGPAGRAEGGRASGGTALCHCPELAARIRPDRGGARRFSVRVSSGAGYRPCRTEGLRPLGLSPGPGFFYPKVSEINQIDCH